MKIRKYRLVLILCLVSFFVIAIFMTIISQMNYKKACVDVISLKKVSSESLTITKSCYVDNKMNSDGELTFAWDDEKIYDILKVGDQVNIDTGSKSLVAEIKNIGEKSGECVLTIGIISSINEILSEKPEGFTVSIDYKGPFRHNVIPASCIIDDKGILKVAVIYSRQKVWGTEYYIHYEMVRIYEMNEEKCALIGLPTDGEIVAESESQLFEGTNVIPR